MTGSDSPVTAAILGELRELIISMSGELGVMIDPTVPPVNIRRYGEF